MEFRDQDFTGQEVTLDGNTFTGCTFRNCRVVFKAIAPCQMSACHFKENIEWALEGPAALTIDVLTSLYHGMGEGGRQLVERTFDNMRRGKK
jgi:hypothetical protein